MHSVSIGDFTVTSLRDGIDPSGPPLVGYDEAEAKAICAAAGVTFVAGFLPMSINAFLIEGPQVCAVVDTGSPDSYAPGTAGFFGDSLAEAGIDPGQVDHVILTHLHIDHTGFLRRAEGAAYFPNAELVLGKAEWDFTHDDLVFENGPRC